MSRSASERGRLGVGIGGDSLADEPPMLACLALPRQAGQLSRPSPPGGDAMANPHFARIGDVWKHGPLVEVLTTMRPDLYAETHAGSAAYQLTPSPERGY